MFELYQLSLGACFCNKTSAILIYLLFSQKKDGNIIFLCKISTKLLTRTLDTTMYDLYRAIEGHLWHESPMKHL